MSEKQSLYKYSVARLGRKSGAMYDIVSPETAYKADPDEYKAFIAALVAALPKKDNTFIVYQQALLFDEVGNVS